MPTPPSSESRATPRTRRVREPWDKLPKYVREVRHGRGVLYQLRPYTGPGPDDCINLGLYPSVHAAEVAKKAYVKLLYHFNDPLILLDRLKAGGHIPAHVLPRWVERGRDGLFLARTRRFRFGRRVLPHGQEIVVGPYRTPEEAYRAMAARLAAVGQEPGVWLIGWEPDAGRLAGTG